MKNTNSLKLAALISLATIATPTFAETCYAQVLAPATYRETTEKVVTREASPNFTTTPAVLGHGERKIKTADAHVEYEIIPATFSEVTETVEVERERIEVETIPATYRTETKRIQTKEATIRWNPACTAIDTTDASTIPANCIIPVPAEFQEVKREVVATPPRTVKRIIPAKTETVTRKILVEPAKIIRKEVPAEYTSIPLTRVEQAASTSTQPGQETTQDIPVTRKIQPERFVRMAVLCEGEKATIVQLQQRLQQLGYYQGAYTGVLDATTRAAVTRFQDDNHLASGAVTLETLQKLQPK